MVFDKSVSDPANITISEDFDFLYRLITSGFYRVLCKSAMGGGEVFVCRLDDNDSNFYLDGSPADLTGQEGDVMVVFLEFWYKWYKVDDNKFLYHFADHNIDGTYIHVPQSLVGAYKGYVSSNRLYSWSDVTPTTNVSLTIVGHQTAPLFWRAPVTARIRLAAWRIRMRLTMRRTWIRAAVLVLLSTEPYPNWLQGNSKDYPYYNIIF